MNPLAERLLAWYTPGNRRMPWRGPQTTPYATWISEMMLQQTRVEAVIPYFERWMERFPTLASLAAASEQEVLSAWEGLGYYSRARNLHRTAQIVMSEHSGELPSTRAGLEALPGIGPYTAGAIASIAFGRDEAALDGNIRRVFARLVNLEIPARSPDGEKQLWEAVREHLPSGQAGDYNQALMDLGATICTAANPRCLLCPLVEYCEAYRLGLQAQRPVKTAKAPIPHYTVAAGILTRGGQVMIARRPPQGLLGGLWEFPGGKQQEGEDLPGCLRRELREELAVEVEVNAPFGVYQHAFTHFRVTLHAFLCELTGSEPQPLEASELRWVYPAELDGFPMGKIDRQISKNLQKQPPAGQPTA